MSHVTGSDPESRVTVADALGQISLTRLTHFTPAKNLWHIAEDGMIRSSKDLADNAPQYFSPTDRERFDQNPDKICCNFEYPNPYYLSHARAKADFTNYPDWVCLLLATDLLLTPGTKFCGCNSARDRGVHAEPGGQALLDCYAEVAQPDSRWTRGKQHHRGAATDLQAEALVPGPADLSYLTGIVVSDASVAQNLYGVLARHSLGPERFRWIIAPAFFDRNTLSTIVRFGGTITETTWTPPREQESS